MSLSTVRAESKRSDLLFAGLGKLARIQRSFQTEIDDSCPTLLITLFLIIHLVDTILSQPLMTSMSVWVSIGLYS